MCDPEFDSWREHQRKIKTEALKATTFRRALSVNDKKARFPGFHQRTVNYKPGQQVEPGSLPLSTDIVLHESVPMSLSDGTTLYSDIFLPGRLNNREIIPEKPIPAIVAWSPYSKQKGVSVLDDFPGRAGVPKHWLSGLQKWEGPDPAFWCAQDYAIINVDTRGAYTSEGDLLIFGHQEAEDGAEFITWISKQPWCNGKVALSGNSWLSIAQWKIGSLRPKGLAALAPWEGFHDFYRYSVCAGGIPFVGFHEDVAKSFASKGKLEDITSYLAGHETWDGYWDDKMAHLEQINTPIYVVASWTNPVHTPGTFKAWSLLPEKTPKWLRVHNKMEWPDYYDDNSQRDLLRFFNYYLHGKTDNGWEQTPTVRLSVLHFGLSDREDTVNRPEKEFPLARTRYTRLYLQEDCALSTQPVATSSTVSYVANSGKLVFEYEMSTSSEMVGYFMAHLVMSCSEHDEMDVFVQIEKLSPARYRQAVMCIRPQSVAIRALLKFMHDWQIGMGGAGMAVHWGPDGQLRAGYAKGKDEKLSKVAEPFYTYKEKQPLGKGEVIALDIQMRPYGMYWEKGDYLRFTVQGSMVIPFPIPGLKTHETNNKGSHVVHCGGRGEDSSYLLVPYV